MENKIRYIIREESEVVKVTVIQDEDTFLQK